MPRVVLHFKKDELDYSEIVNLGILIKPMVAKLIDPKFTDKDVDWMPLELHPAADVIWPFQIDLETIGFDERIDRLTDEAIIEFNRNIISDRRFPERHRPWFMTPDNPLVWTRHQHKRGVHV